MKLVLITAGLLAVSITAALADATSVIVHKNGGKTTVVSTVRSGGSWVTVTDKNGSQVSSSFRQGGQGSCEVHKAFLKRYMKSGDRLEGPC